MCTSIKIRATDNSYYWGRTMDFATNVLKRDAGIVFLPKGTEFIGVDEPWSNKYDILGIGASIDKTTFLFDGINQSGLVGGLQVLKESCFASREYLQEHNLTPLYSEEVVTWILSNYSTTDEIASAMENYGIIDECHPVIKELGQTAILQLHYTFMDKSGKSIVLEPTESGKFKIFTDTLGVMTNSPKFDWHLANLSNYVQLQQQNTGAQTLKSGQYIKQIGYGSGLLGLPGDYTSPSRFVRATFISNFAATPDKEAGIRSLYNAFRSVYVPKGVEVSDENNELTNYTLYWSGYDVNELSLYVQLDASQTMTKVSLAEFAEQKERKVVVIPKEQLFNRIEL